MTTFDEVLTGDAPFVCPDCGRVETVERAVAVGTIAEATLECGHCDSSISSLDMSMEVPSYFAEVDGHEVVFMDGKAQCIECGSASRNELSDFPRANDDITRMFLMGQLLDNGGRIDNFDEWVDRKI